jgi:hypothetical protein
MAVARGATDPADLPGRGSVQLGWRVEGIGPWVRHGPVTASGSGQGDFQVEGFTADAPRARSHTNTTRQAKADMR